MAHTTNKHAIAVLGLTVRCLALQRLGSDGYYGVWALLSCMCCRSGEHLRGDGECVLHCQGASLHNPPLSRPQSGSRYT